LKQPCNEKAAVDGSEQIILLVRIVPMIDLNGRTNCVRYRLADGHGLGRRIKIKSPVWIAGGEGILDSIATICRSGRFADRRLRWERRRPRHPVPFEDEVLKPIAFFHVLPLEQARGTEMRTEESLTVKMSIS
jgi:hypothetical protein